MDVFRQDVKSGLFILVALALFLFAVFQVGGLLSRLGGGRDIILDFENSQQVTEGTELLLRGKNIGRVAAVTFAPNGQSVHIHCRVEVDIPLLRGMRARVADKSVLGGKIIELLPPADGGVGVELGPDDVIVGLPAGGLTAAIASLNGLLDGQGDRVASLLANADALAVNLDGVVKEARVQLENFSTVQPKLTETLETYRVLAVQSRADIGKLTADIEVVLAELKPMAKELRTELTALTGQLRRDSADIKQKLDTVLTHSEGLTGNADMWLTENYAALEASLAGLNRTIRNFEVFSAKIAARPSSLIRRGRKGAGRSSSATEDLFLRELRDTGYMGRKGAGEDQR